MVRLYLIILLVLLLGCGTKRKAFQRDMEALMQRSEQTTRHLNEMAEAQRSEKRNTMEANFTFHPEEEGSQPYNGDLMPYLLSRASGLQLKFDQSEIDFTYKQGREERENTTVEASSHLTDTQDLKEERDTSLKANIPWWIWLIFAVVCALSIGGIRSYFRR